MPRWDCEFWRILHRSPFEEIIQRHAPLRMSMSPGQIRISSCGKSDACEGKNMLIRSVSGNPSEQIKCKPPESKVDICGEVSNAGLCCAGQQEGAQNVKMYGIPKRTEKGTPRALDEKPAAPFQLHSFWSTKRASHPTMLWTKQSPS